MRRGPGAARHGRSGARARRAAQAQTLARRARRPPATAGRVSRRGWASARRRSRPTRRALAARRRAGAGLVRARPARGGTRGTGPRRRMPTSARSTSCPPTSRPAWRWPACCGAGCSTARHSMCWSSCSPPTRTRSRRSCCSGKLLLEEGRIDKALEAFRRARCASIPSTPPRSSIRRDALARARRFGEASDAWDRVSQIDPAGPLAAPARSRARSARDLLHIFTAQAG